MIIDMVIAKFSDLAELWAMCDDGRAGASDEYEMLVLITSEGANSGPWLARRVGTRRRPEQ